MVATFGTEAFALLTMVETIVTGKVATIQGLLVMFGLLIACSPELLPVSSSRSLRPCRRPNRTNSAIPIPARSPLATLTILVMIAVM